MTKRSGNNRVFIGPARSPVRQHCTGPTVHGPVGKSGKSAYRYRTGAAQSSTASTRLWRTDWTGARSPEPSGPRSGGF